MVINQTTLKKESLIVEATLFSLHGLNLGKVRYNVEVEANSKVIAGSLFTDSKPDGFYFVRLQLKDHQNMIIDENITG